MNIKIIIILSITICLFGCSNKELPIEQKIATPIIDNEETVDESDSQENTYPIEYRNESIYDVLNLYNQCTWRENDKNVDYACSVEDRLYSLTFNYKNKKEEYDISFMHECDMLFGPTCANWSDDYLIDSIIQTDDKTYYINVSPIEYDDYTHTFVMVDEDTNDEIIEVAFDDVNNEHYVLYKEEWSKY